MVPDTDTVNIFFLGPHRQPGSFVRAPQQGHMTADGDRAAEQFNIPGFNYISMGAQGAKLGNKITADIKILEPVPGLFNIVWARITSYNVCYTKLLRIPIVILRFMAGTSFVKFSLP